MLDLRFVLLLCTLQQGGSDGSRVVSVLDSGAEGRAEIAVATLSGNSFRQTVHTHCASIHQAAKLATALLRVTGVTVGLAESNGSLPPGLWLTSPACWLPRTGISSGTLRSVIEYGLPLPLQYNCGLTVRSKRICYVMLSSSSVYLPNNTTVGLCTFASIQF